MLKHTILTWLATCAAGTLILCLFFGSLGMPDSGVDMQSIALIVFAITLLVSIPAMILYGFIAQMMVGRIPALGAKALCSLYALAATMLSCYIIINSLGSELSQSSLRLIGIGLPYSVCFALMVWTMPAPIAAPYITEEESAPETDSITLTPPTAFYVIAAINGLLLLYSISMALPELLKGRNELRFTIWQLLYIVLGALSLILFIFQKAIGWKLMVLLSASSIAGMFIYAASLIAIVRKGTPIYHQLALEVLFVLLDITTFYLLSRPELRRFFGRGKQEYGWWALAGAIYAIAQMGLMKWMFNWF